MKICIFGAGAIGGYLGVQLSLAGADVHLIARGRHLAAMRENGLSLKIGDEVRVAPVNATDDPREVGVCDYVIVCLKAHQAHESVDQFPPLLGPETTVVTAMNGVPWWYFYKLDGPYENLHLQSVDPGDMQWRIIKPERAVGCVVYPATHLEAPGVVKHTYGNKFTLGEPDGSMSERCRRIGELMERAGLKAPVRDNIRDDIWIKLWGNLCFNPISALTGGTLDIVATDPATRPLARNMMIEAQEIGHRLGVHFRVDVERRIDGAAGVGAHKTSMLQDIEGGRAMEIDALVTAVQEMGDLVGVDTPYIDAVLGLIQQRGRSMGVYPTFVPPESIDTAEWRVD